MGTAKTRAQNKYIGKTYDRINFTVPKSSGGKRRIRDAADAVGQSVNAYIAQAVDDRIARDKSPPGDKIK